MSKTIPPSGSAAHGQSPTTNQARRRLSEAVNHAFSEQINTLINAPTSLGKTHLVASTSWGEYPEITGGNPVLHLHGSTDNRDDAAKLSREAGVKYVELKSGLDICPTAKGSFDDELSSIQGETASEWLKQAVYGGGYEFSKAQSITSTAA